MPENWCEEKLLNLRDRDKLQAALMDIRGQLNDQKNHTDLIIRRLLCSDELFMCLEVQKDNIEHEMQVGIATDIIALCLNLVQLDTTDNDTYRVLRRSFRNRRSSIRALGLACLLKELRRQTAACEVKLLPSNDIILCVLGELKQQDSCSAPATSILQVLLLQRLHETAVHEEILKLLKENEIVRCRLYELAVKIAKRNATSLNAVEFILNSALSELDNDDVLLQSTILEILTTLAEYCHGMNYMEHHSLLRIVSERVRNVEQNPFDNLLVPSIMKFFGKIGTMQPQKIITGYPDLLDCLFETLKTEDYSLLPPAADTLANLACTQQGKVLLNEHYSKRMKESLQTLGRDLNVVPSDLKVRLFNTLQVIFTVEGSLSPQLSEMLYKWIRCISGGNNLMIFLDFCRNPFPDIKIACLALVKTLCRFDWGVRMFRNTATFLEFMLDRKLEVDKDVKLAKWELIEVLSKNADFDVQTILRLDKYVKDGPYFAAAEMSVAVEGE